MSSESEIASAHRFPISEHWIFRRCDTSRVNRVQISLVYFAFGFSHFPRHWRNFFPLPRWDCLDFENELFPPCSSETWHLALFLSLAPSKRFPDENIIVWDSQLNRGGSHEFAAWNTILHAPREFGTSFALTVSKQNYKFAVIALQREGAYFFENPSVYSRSGVEWQLRVIMREFPFALSLSLSFFSQRKNCINVWKTESFPRYLDMITRTSAEDPNFGSSSLFQF